MSENKNNLSNLPKVDMRALRGFSNSHLNLGEEKIVKEEYREVKNISKLLKANLSKDERMEFQQLAYVPNEQIVGVITEIELDRYLYHAYKLGASELSIMTGQPFKCIISDYIFKLSKRILTPEDITVINKRLYGGENIVTHISSKNDANIAYTVKLDKLPEDIVERLSPEEKQDIVRFRVNITPVALEMSDGTESSLRIIRPDPMTFDEMFVDPEIRESYVRQTDGLIVICGGTGNGKTSLLSGFVCDMIVSGRDLKIITYEQPIEIRYDKLLNSVDHNVILTQTEIYRQLTTFQAGVENSLRRTAKVAIVGEAKNYSSIAAAVEFAQTGGLLFTTLHVNNSIGEALYRMVNMFPENERSIKVYEIIEAMRVCVIQRLEKSPLGGRVAIREFLEFTPAIISELRSLPDVNAMVIRLKTLVKKYGFSMADSARKRFAEGNLTADRLAYYERLDEVATSLAEKKK